MGAAVEIGYGVAWIEEIDEDIEEYVEDTEDDDEELQSKISEMSALEVEGHTCRYRSQLIAISCRRGIFLSVHQS